LQALWRCGIVVRSPQERLALTGTVPTHPEVPVQLRQAPRPIAGILPDREWRPGRAARVVHVYAPRIVAAGRLQALPVRLDVLLPEHGQLRQVRKLPEVVGLRADRMERVPVVGHTVVRVPQQRREASPLPPRHTG